MAKRALKVVVPTAPIKLDLGCGPHKQAGFIGVDRRRFDGVDVVHDLLKPWPWKEGSVEEIFSSHVFEHFNGKERVFLFNEMGRVLQKGGKAVIVTPHWCSNRAYGDFTHQWPPVSELLYYYVSREWRMANAPDNDIQWNPDGYSCDFHATWGYTGVHAQLQHKNEEAKMFAATFYKEACGDIIATLVNQRG